jgi:hypothetical protein
MTKEKFSHRYRYWCWGANTIKELRAIVRKNGYEFVREWVCDYK